VITGTGRTTQTLYLNSCDIVQQWYVRIDSIQVTKSMSTQGYEAGEAKLLLSESLREGPPDVLKILSLRAFSSSSAVSESSSARFS
jgi:hypothetical protein